MRPCRVTGRSPTPARPTGLCGSWARSTLRPTRYPELAEQQIAAIEAWRGAEHGRLGTQREHWEALLGQYHRQRLEEDEKAKTIRLPHGTLTARKLPDGIVIEDEDALLKWARTEAPDYVRTRVDLNHSAIKSAVLKSGEIIPGVSATVGEVRYAVTTEVAP